jgi:hypothetical protein
MFTHRHRFLLTTLLIALMAVTGCGSDEGNNETVETAPAPEAAHQHAPVPASVPGAFISGTIVETMNSGGYSYVLLDTGSSRVWVAGPQVEGLAVDQKVSCPDGMEMKDFRANSLDRTFASILFVGAINTGDQPAAAANPHGGGMGGMGGMPGMSPKGGSEVNANAIVAKAAVEKMASPDGGYNIADIYAKSGELGGKTVKVRGQVVKFSPRIMGTNWVHIQDGSGDAATSDLTVTTDATVAPGDVVLVEGVLAVDKDFGAGYKYHVIVEKAAVTKE